MGSAAYAIAATPGRPASGWALTFVEACQKAGAQILPIVTMIVTAPDGTTTSVQLADVPLASKSLGQFLPKVMNWSQVKAVIVPGTYSLPNDEFTIDIEDNPDPVTGIRFFAQLAKGPLSSQLLKSPITIQLASPDPSAGPEAWPTDFTGVISGFDRTGTNKVTISFRPDDYWLAVNVPRTIITYADAPNADAATITQPYPNIFGIFDSAGTTTAGAIPCACIDRKNNLWLVMAGASWSSPTQENEDNGQTPFVPAVYINGGLLGTLEWQLIQNYKFGAKSTTVIKILVPTTTATKITCDIAGAEDVGDGTGMLLATPGSQLALWLSNYVWKTYLSGLYFPADEAPLDLESFYDFDDFNEGNCLRRHGAGLGSLATIGRSSSRLIGGTVTGGSANSQKAANSFVSDWLSSMRAYALWNSAGKLQILRIDHRARRTYFDGPVRQNWIRALEASLDKDGLQQLEDRSNLVDHPSAEFALDSVQAKAQAVITVEHQARKWKTETKDDQYWATYQLNVPAIAQPIGIVYADSVYQPFGVGTLLEGVTPPAAQVQPLSPAPQLPVTTGVKVSGLSGGTKYLRFQLPHFPPAMAIESVSVSYGAILKTGPNFSASVVAYFYNPKTGGYYATSQPHFLTNAYTKGFPELQWFNDVWGINRVTGLPWQPGDLDNIELALAIATTNSGTEIVVPAIWIAVTQQGETASALLVREILTQKLATFGKPVDTSAITLPMWGGALIPGDPLAISSPLADGPNGEAWGIQPWERWLHLHLGATRDYQNRTFLLSALDMREQRPAIFENSITDQGSGSGVYSPGVARLGRWRPRARPATPGDGRVFTRPSPGWCNDSQDGNIVQAVIGGEEYDAQGLYVGNASQTTVRHTALDTAYWVVGNVQRNGSFVKVDTAFPPIFDPGPTSAVWVVNFGTVSNDGVDKYFCQLAIPNLIPAGQKVVPTVVTFQIEVSNDAGALPSVAVQRSSDGKWLIMDRVAGNWSGSLVWNPLAGNFTSLPWLTAPGTNPSMTRYWIPGIVLNERINEVLEIISDGVYRVQIGFPGGSTPARSQCHVGYFDFQPEANMDALPARIYTTAPTPTSLNAAGTGADRLLQYYSHHGDPAWDPERGVAFGIFNPLWIDDGGEANAIATCYFVSSANPVAGAPFDYDWVYYSRNSAGSTLNFDRVVNGILYECSIPINVPIGPLAGPYGFACRWTSQEGELDLPPFTLDLWWFDGFDWHKAGDVDDLGGVGSLVAAPHANIATPALLTWGARPDLPQRSASNAFWQYHRVWTEAWTDAEVIGRNP